MWEKIGIFLNRIKDFLNIDNRSLFIVFTICISLLLMPVPIWDEFNLITQWLVFRPWVFAIGLIAFIWFASASFFDFGKLVKEKILEAIKHQRTMKLRLKTISNISKVEKEILAKYIQEDSTTLAFDARDGVINGLISKGILVRASNASNPFTAMDFDINIQPWAWEYLKSNPELLKGIEPIVKPRHHPFD